MTYEGSPRCSTSDPCTSTKDPDHQKETSAFEQQTRDQGLLTAAEI